MKTLKNYRLFVVFFRFGCASEVSGGHWVSLGDTGGSWAGPWGHPGRFLGVLGGSLGALAGTLGVPGAPLGVPG